MARPKLRAVSPDQPVKSQPQRPRSIVAAAADGDRLDLLIAMRDRIARALDGDCPPRDLAALTKRLDDIVEKIAAIEAAQQGAGAEQGGALEDDDDESFDASAI